MKVIFTRRATDQFDRRIAYSIDRFGKRVTNRIFGLVDKYIHTTIANDPIRTGTHHPAQNFYEAWVPRTPFFIIYRVDQAADTVTILAIYHHAQDRRNIDPD